jgi:hypothetical protein
MLRLMFYERPDILLNNCRGNLVECQVAEKRVIGLFESRADCSLGPARYEYLPLEYRPVVFHSNKDVDDFIDLMIFALV